MPYQFKKLSRLLIAILVLGSTTMTHAGSLKPGDPAPPFRLPKLDGQIVSLKQLTSQGHVLLVFWELECVYCFSHIKDFNALQKKYQGRLTIAGINFLGEYADEVREYAKNNGVHYTLLADRLNNIDVAEAYKVIGSPTMVLVSPQGRILYYGYKIPALEQWLN